MIISFAITDDNFDTIVLIAAEGMKNISKTGRNKKNIEQKYIKIPQKMFRIG